MSFTRLYTHFSCIFHYHRIENNNQLTKIALEALNIVIDTLNDAPSLITLAYLSAKRIIYKKKSYKLHVQNGNTLNVFIHGYLHDNSGWVKFENKLKKDTNDPYLTLSLSNTTQDITLSAKEVDVRIQEAIQKLEFHNGIQIQKVNLVGHSMGGIVASTLVEDIKPCYNVEKVVTIGSPLRGTMLGPFGFGRSAKQMHYQSNFLQSLTEKMKNNKTTSYYCVASKGDQLIKPYHSCFLYPYMGEGNNQKNQYLQNRLGHTELILNNGVVNWVHKQLYSKNAA